MYDTSDDEFLQTEKTSVLGFSGDHMSGKNEFFVCIIILAFWKTSFKKSIKVSAPHLIDQCDWK